VCLCYRKNSSIQNPEEASYWVALICNQDATLFSSSGPQRCLHPIKQKNRTHPKHTFFVSFLVHYMHFNYLFQEGYVLTSVCLFVCYLYSTTSINSLSSNILTSTLFQPCQRNLLTQNAAGKSAGVVDMDTDFRFHFRFGK